MQIIIPMSGFGERFRRQGYTLPKPLIDIDGRPLISYVVDLFPGEDDILFICNQDHLDNPDYGMRDTLQRIRPKARIVGIAPHKLGPVHAIDQVRGLVDPDKPTLVNYCDFTCFWDWRDFKNFVKTTDCDGAIPAYRGFHPHSLGTTNYAYIRESGSWIEDIQEKQPFTDDRMKEFASTGTYYFASGALMFDAFDRMKEADLQVGGEYYVSLAYKPLLQGGKKVAVYGVQHFMQWGTPEDVEEYKNWSQAFRNLLRSREEVPPLGSLVVPMAGLGQRFADEGYKLTKPLIPASGRPMVVQAAATLPQTLQQVFVLRGDMPMADQVEDDLRKAYPAARFEILPAVTEGQACTAMEGVSALLESDETGPVTIGACDFGALYDRVRLGALLQRGGADVVVWGVRGYATAARRPEMFGWVDAEQGAIRRISVKQPLSNPKRDAIVLGAFTFRTADIFQQCVERLIARDGRVNGEFYIDSCINDAVEMGFDCQLFEVDSVLSWGTPNDLKTFEYWQSCFHKWSGHPYRLERDSMVPTGELAALGERYAATRPPRPAPVR